MLRRRAGIGGGGVFGRTVAAAHEAEAEEVAGNKGRTMTLRWQVTGCGCSLKFIIKSS